MKLLFITSLTEVSMRQWTAKEMDLFIAIVSKVMNKKQDVVTLDTEELRTIISEKRIWIGGKKQ